MADRKFLFRIVQEALHNVIKHAKASEISIKADFNESHLHLFIKDNGCGFEFNHAGDSHGSGLRNMESRSKLIGATFGISSVKETGTEIHLDLPLGL